MNPSADLGKAHLRIARPSDDLEALVHFYRDGLGFEVLSSFTNHDGFDGVMLGQPGAAYHLEFTRKTGHQAGKAPTEDNLLVFYLPDEDMWNSAVARLEDLVYHPVQSFNPYWDRNGKTFEDSDGYRVVLQNAAGKLASCRPQTIRKKLVVGKYLVTCNEPLTVIEVYASFDRSYHSSGTIKHEVPVNSVTHRYHASHTQFVLRSRRVFRLQRRQDTLRHRRQG